VVEVKKKILVFTALLLNGCYYLGHNKFKDIIPHPSRDWSAPECLTVIMEAGEDNLLDKRTNIKAIVTPYYPSVVKALNREAQKQSHWSEKVYQQTTDRLIYESCGMFVDWEDENEPVYDYKLKPLNNPLQFDSVMFLLTLRNVGWPCGKKLRLSVPTSYGYREIIIPLEEPDCVPPDIKNIQNMISLMNQRTDILHPKTVSGRKMSYLTNIEETIFIKFIFNDGEKHFLDSSDAYYLFILNGFESEIRFKFPIDYMR